MAGVKFATASGIFTPQGLAAALRQFGQKMDVPILVGLEQGLGSARAGAINAFIRRGVGRRIFGQKAGGAAGLIKVLPARKVGQRYVGTLQARGMAAIQDQGGRTSPHTIAPKNKRFLVYRTKAGVLHITDKPVQHPGAQHPAMPFLQQAIASAAPRVATLIDREIQKLATKLKVA